MILGMGVDIVEVARVERMIKKGGTRLLAKVFSPAEKEYCQQRRFPFRSFAGRIAAKEAFFKAIGTGWNEEVNWKNVEVTGKRGKTQTLNLYGQAKEVALRQGCREIWVAISHTDGHAVSQVVIEG